MLRCRLGGDPPPVDEHMPEPLRLVRLGMESAPGMPVRKVQRASPSNRPTRDRRDFSTDDSPSALASRW